MPCYRAALQALRSAQRSTRRKEPRRFFAELLSARQTCCLLRLHGSFGLHGFFCPPACDRDGRPIAGTCRSRRFASRTTILRRAMDDELFKGKRLRDLQGRKPLLVVNAAELRTASAFYFTASQSGSWRLGRLVSTDITLAHAVTASAAYPMFLPALDEELPFDKRDGARRSERVTLDGRRRLRQSGPSAALARPRSVDQSKRRADRYHYLLQGGVRATPRPTQPVYDRAPEERHRLHPRPGAERDDEATV